ncbi:hypothetical protein [uncultured Shewanella sp.]|uniref:hypothetical protein n=1 Tax=uncultured Shewanella sp. TaxID=173975 RepID=UPI0026330488|nr:hypothetical protein [uncultured Shewanella sp.]
MKDALKVVRNNNPKKQLYKKDPSIPNHQADLNTRTFVTPLKEKAPAKNSDGSKSDDSDTNKNLATSEDKNTVNSTATKPTGARLGKRKISDALYADLRKKTPNKAMRKEVNKGVSLPFPDEALPGMEVTKKLQADHIVPMEKITRMDGFEKLTFEKQVDVLNTPENFIGLSASANTSKGAKTYAEWTEHKKTGTPVNPEFRSKMMEVEKKVEVELQVKIDKLVQ